MSRKTSSKCCLTCCRAQISPSVDHCCFGARRCRQRKCNGTSNRLAPRHRRVPASVYGREDGIWAGMHSSIFVKTWLRGQRCLEDINNFWMAHKPKTMSEIYSHLHEELRLRLDEAERVGYGFDLSKTPNHSVIDGAKLRWWAVQGSNLRPPACKSVVHFNQNLPERA